MKNSFVVVLGLFALSAFGQKPGNLQVNQSPQVEKLQQDYLKENAEQESIKGYRVQIYNGRKNDCMRERSLFLQNFPKVAAYTLYESPEYRIQVGDFRTRLEAEAFRKQILDKHTGSFVILTKIKWPEVKMAKDQ